MPQDSKDQADELELLTPEESEALAARENRPATIPPTREVELQDGEVDAETLSPEELRERERRIRSLRPGSGVRLKTIVDFDLHDSIETDPDFGTELVESDLELETDPPPKAS